MSMTEKLPLSPMLVQYLVGLCALKWNARSVSIDVTLGNMVEDQASRTRRDVDVTVTVGCGRTTLLMAHSAEEFDAVLDGVLDELSIAAIAAASSTYPPTR